MMIYDDEFDLKRIHLWSFSVQKGKVIYMLSNVSFIASAND